MAKKRNKRIAISFIVDDKDRLLMGKRNDNGKWTVPGGHIDEGEDPFEGMIRELKEEAGLDAKELKLVKVGMEDGLLLYLFEIKVDPDQKVDCSADPDNECDTFTYEDPFDHIDNLHVAAKKNWAVKHWIGR